MARMGYCGAVTLDQKSDFRKRPGRPAMFIQNSLLLRRYPLRLVLGLPLVPLRLLLRLLRGLLYSRRRQRPSDQPELQNIFCSCSDGTLNPGRDIQFSFATAIKPCLATSFVAPPCCDQGDRLLASSQSAMSWIKT